MALAFDIVPTTKSAKLDASGKGQLEFTVTNALKRDVRARVRVVPEGQTKAEWLKLDATEKDLKADGTAKFAVNIAAPKEAAAGEYAFHILVASVAKPDDEFANGPTVSFPVTPPPPEGKKPFPWWILIVVGAVVLIGGGVGLYFLLTKGVNPGDPCKKGECPDSMACVSNVCLLTDGSTCKKATDCQSGMCEKEKCAVDPVNQAVNVLDDAIDALQNASADRQKVLQEAQQKLPQDSAIRKELDTLAKRSIAQAGVELRCDADVIRTQILRALEGIKAGLLKESVPKLEPALCQVVPLGVDRGLVPDRLKQVEFYGYDFDTDPTLRVWLERAGQPRLDVTGKLGRPTHYAMTLKFGATGVQLDDRSERFALEWGGRTITTIAVFGRGTPVCGSKVEQLDGRKVTFKPRRAGRGDADFHGHGPEVRTTVTLLPAPDVLRARVYMKARETRSDWTEASGYQDFELYRPPPGWAIKRLPGTPQASHSYVDRDHNLDSYDLGGGLVKRLEYVGDTSGNEAGTRTQVTVFFNRIPVELRQTGNCVPQ